MLVRSATPADAHAIGNIAYDTGYFGSSAAAFFPDVALFRDLWVGPYLEGAGVDAWVAELDGQVVGYLAGAADSRSFRRALARLAPVILRRWLRGSFPLWRKSLRYLLRLLRYQGKAAPAHDYPAHLHLNVLPFAQGLGAGSALLDAYLKSLRDHAVAGVQLSTTRENAAAVRLYQHFGFEIWSENRSPLWRPWLGRDAVHLVMTRRI